MKRKISRRAYLYIAVIVLAAAIYMAYVIDRSSLHGASPYAIINTGPAEVRIGVEIADTPDEWRRGLMFRQFLPEDRAMLFVFDDESRWTFWMKDTPIPLDIIFVSSDFSIVDIKENFSPCTSDPCEQYTPKAEAKYALEVNAGFVQKHGIKTGQKFSIST